MCHEVFGGLEADAAVHLSKTFSVDRDENGCREGHHLPLHREQHLLPFSARRTSPMCPMAGGGYQKLARTVGCSPGGLRSKSSADGQICDAIMDTRCPPVMVMLEA